MNQVTKWASLNAALAVALAAMGAHAVKDRISPEMLEIYKTGGQYHLIMGIAAVLVAALVPAGASQVWIGRAQTLLLIGCLLFSGSLYALALSGVKVLGAITPLGGVCFISGWVLVFLAFHFSPSRPSSCSDA